MNDLTARCAAQAALARSSDAADERRFAGMVRRHIRTRDCTDPGALWASYCGLVFFARARVMRKAAALSLWPLWPDEVGVTQEEYDRFASGTEDHSLEEHGELSVCWFKQPPPQHKHGDWRWACAPALLSRARAATQSLAGDCPKQLQALF